MTELVVPKPIPLTDTGNAERMAAQCAGRIHYVPELGKFIAHDGRRWVVDVGQVRASSFAKDVVRGIYLEAANITDDKQRQAIAAWAARSESKAGREAMLSLARAEPRMAVSLEAFDTDALLFNVENGTIDLRTGELREHRAADLITKIAPVTYDPSTESKLLVNFLDRIMGSDAERIEFLRRYFGYCLTGSVREHVLTFWHGPGGNGKSVLGNLMLRIMGDYAGKAAPNLLFGAQKMDRHPTEIADLKGLRLVLANETQRSRTWDEATLKDITGGDVLRARRMHQDFWSFAPTHKILVFGNHKPRFDSSPDGGVKRRLRLVPFDVTIPKSEIDRELADKLWADASGVLRWMVDGCLAWQRDGLSEPKAIAEATRVYFAAEDVLGQFFDSRCVFGPEERVSRKELRADYEVWCEERGEKPAAARTLGAAVQERGASPCKVKVGGVPKEGWRGVRLKRLDEREADADAVAVAVGSGQIPPFSPTRTHIEKKGENDRYATATATQVEVDYDHAERAAIESEAAQ